MPEKTQAGSRRCCLGLSGSLELLRSAVVQGRVQSQLIVVLIDELLEVSAQLGHVLILLGVDLFALQGLDEALALRVVVRVGWPAHAGPDAVAAQGAEVLLRGVLDAEIGE